MCMGDDQCPFQLDASVMNLAEIVAQIRAIVMEQAKKLSLAEGSLVHSGMEHLRLSLV